MVESNPYRWDSVVMNSPGKIEYDPRKPCVYKLNKAAGRIAVHFVTFVNDVRVVGGNHKEITSAMYRIAILVNYLGEQNSSRKIREVSQDPGMWIGALMEKDNDDIYLSTSAEK